VNTWQQIVPAAYFQRIDTLFLADDQQQWGTFDPDNNQLRLHDEPQPDDHELGNEVARYTLLNGGTVITTNAEEVGADEKLAAILRY
jgi:hypothetical protein